MRYFIIEAETVSPDFEIVGGLGYCDEKLATSRFEDRHAHGPVMATRALVLAHNREDARQIFTSAITDGKMYANIVGLYGTL